MKWRHQESKEKREQDKAAAAAAAASAGSPTGTQNLPGTPTSSDLSKSIRLAESSSDFPKPRVFDFASIAANRYLPGQGPVETNLRPETGIHLREMTSSPETSSDEEELPNQPDAKRPKLTMMADSTVESEIKVD